MIEEHIFNFRTSPKYFYKESHDIKNNTIREIVLSDERFTNLIAWMQTGWNDGDIEIKITHALYEDRFFTRNIRDITIWNNLMIITWNSEHKINP